MSAGKFACRLHCVPADGAIIIVSCKLLWCGNSKSAPIKSRVRLNNIESFKTAKRQFHLDITSPPCCWWHEGSSCGDGAAAAPRGRDSAAAWRWPDSPWTARCYRKAVERGVACTWRSKLCVKGRWLNKKAPVNLHDPEHLCLTSMWMWWTRSRKSMASSMVKSV